jgi:HK97 gp10 family phage protein
MTIRTEIDIKGVEGVIATLSSLPAEVVSKRGGPVKLALAKGARKLRDYAKRNLRAAIAQNGERSTGELEKRVISSRGKAPFGGKGERYLVRVKKRDYINADGVKTNPLMTANLLEWGSSHQPATPWLRPAVQEHGTEVIDIVTADLLRRLDQTVRKLASQNKVRG